MADDNKPKGQPTTLKITSCTTGYTGVNKRGDEYTIYRVEATKPDGTPVDQKLSSFEDLPVGEVLELVATRFESEKHGVSYTLSRKDRPGSRKQVEQLTKLVNELVGRVEHIENYLQNKANANVVQQQQPPQRTQELDERYGAAPPF